MIKRIFGIRKESFLKVYRGYGSEKSFVVIGHVSENFTRREITDKTPRLQNTLFFIRSYLSGPIAGKTVRVEFNGQQHSAVTSEDGFFEIAFTPQSLTLSEGSEWLMLDVALDESDQSIAAPVLIEGHGNTYGIISDIDDTVLISHVANKVKLLLNTFTKNYLTRRSFEHVSLWYHALMEGSDGVSTNPLFYVSSSHWNLYEFLKDFFDTNNLPKGPLMLKRFSGVRGLIKAAADHSHKQEKIEHLLETYPALQFILIGDSGQHDPTLYANIVEEFPNRIKAIYIRDVIPGRDPRIEEAQQRVGDRVPIISFEKTLDAMKDSQERGFIL